MSTGGVSQINIQDRLIFRFIRPYITYHSFFYISTVCAVHACKTVKPKTNLAAEKNNSSPVLYMCCCALEPLRHASRCTELTAAAADAKR